MLVTFSIIHVEDSFGASVTGYLAGPRRGSQSRGLFRFLFIAVLMLGVYVVPASKDLGEWDRLCLINHLISLTEREPQKDGSGRRFRPVSLFMALEGIF